MSPVSLGAILFQSLCVCEWASLFATAILSVYLLCSVLGYSLQERHLGVGVCSEKDSEAGERTRAQVLWEAVGFWPENRGKLGEDVTVISLTTRKDIAVRGKQ